MNAMLILRVRRRVSLMSARSVQEGAAANTILMYSFARSVRGGVGCPGQATQKASQKTVRLTLLNPE
jgi:hypothetical protein